jgi:hypothetical protein
VAEPRRLILGGPLHQTQQVEGLRMPLVPDVARIAALTTCESPLLALNDRKILPKMKPLGF